MLVSHTVKQRKMKCTPCKVNLASQHICLIVKDQHDQCATLCAANSTCDARAQAARKAIKQELVITSGSSSPVSSLISVDCAAHTKAVSRQPSEHHKYICRIRNP